MTVKVIAEIGVNFDRPNGSLQTAVELIDEAQKCNCNYVKFQLFNEQNIKDSPLFERLKPLILSEGDIEFLRRTATVDKIGFILTPMYLEAVDLAAKYADMIKIRYADHKNQPLIDKALDTYKTVLISVPYRPLAPQLTYNPQIKWMFNIPKYPPEIEDFNLDYAVACDGFSSHFPHTICDLAFAINRLHEEVYIEKHVMPYRPSHPIFDSPENQLKYGPLIFIDETVSITFEELKNFVDQLKMIERIKRIRL